MSLEFNHFFLPPYSSSFFRRYFLLKKFFSRKQFPSLVVDEAVFSSRCIFDAGTCESLSEDDIKQIVLSACVKVSLVQEKCFLKLSFFVRNCMFLFGRGACGMLDVNVSRMLNSSLSDVGQKQLENSWTFFIETQKILNCRRLISHLIPAGCAVLPYPSSCHYGLKRQSERRQTAGMIANEWHQKFLCA